MANDTEPHKQSDQSTDDVNSLESTNAAAESDDLNLDGDSGADSYTNLSAETPPPPSSNKPGLFKRWYHRINIYVLLFVLVIVAAGTIIAIAYLQNRRATKTEHFQSQGINQSTLNQLANGDVTVGNNQSVLNVRASAVFAGQVMVKQNLQVAGDLQSGGTAAFSSMTVSGDSQLGQLTISKNLSVAGNGTIQGSLTIAKNLQVNGGGIFSGTVSTPQVTTSSLQLNGDLNITRHITTGGGTPARSSGSALGGGGSVGVSGSDTAGSVSVNTGSNPVAGCFVTLTFSVRYNNTPHVLITPVGSAAGGLSYYVNRSASGFSICDATTPPAGSSFGFDYFVVD
jgi:cytoskeletal protein CcmA (bactofilin family)